MSHAQHRNSIFLAFGAFGLMGGIVAVANSQLKLDFHLTDNHFGTILTIASIVGLPLQYLGGPLLHRFGRGLFAAICVTRAFALFGIVAATNSWQLYFLFAPLYIAAGLYNIVINAGALHYEHVSNKHIMGNAHALFSIGAIGGSLLGGLTLHFGAGLWGTFGVAGVISMLALLTTDVAAGLAHDPDAGDRPKFDWNVISNPGFKTIALVSMFGGFGEVVMYTWPVIYLRENLHSAAFVGALGSTGFYAAMAFGRLGASPVQKKFGQISTLIAAGVLIVIGMSIGLSTTTVAITIIGFVLAGIAYSVVVPVSMSLGAKTGSNTPASVAGLLSAANSSITLLSPVLVGTLAGATTLRTALGLVIVSGLIVAIGSAVFKHEATALAATN